MDGVCGRFAVTVDPALLAAEIDAVDETAGAGPAAAAGTGPDYTVPNYAAPNYTGPNYNVAPTTAIATVVRRHARPEEPEPLDDPAGVATRRVRLMRWGLVPPWAKPGPDGAPQTTRLLINARADNATSSPAFRAAARSRRCLIPMDGWYEWRAEPPTAVAGRATRARKTPFYLSRTDGKRLMMAGLWSVWRPDERSAPLLSCAIITTGAVGPLAEVHDRMPLPIAESDWDRWLDPDTPADPALLSGAPDAAEITAREVSTLVNSVRNNGPELLDPAGPQPWQPTLL